MIVVCRISIYLCVISYSKNFPMKHYSVVFYLPDLSSPRISGEVRVAHLFSFFMLSYYVSLRSDFHIETMLGSSLSPVVCRRGHVWYTLFVFVCVWWWRVVFLLCLSSFCVRYVASFSGLSIFDYTFGVLKRLFMHYPITK